VPRFEVGTGATIHMESATPADIVSPAGVPAAPTKSLFQIDVVGLRMTLMAAWGMRNPAHVAIVISYQWGSGWLGILIWAFISAVVVGGAFYYDRVLRLPTTMDD
jgi:hypothetical protein